MKKKIIFCVLFISMCASGLFAWGKKKKEEKNPVDELKQHLIGRCYHANISHRTNGTGGESMHIAFLNESELEEIFIHQHYGRYDGSFKSVISYPFVDRGNGEFILRRNGTDLYYKIWWREGDVDEIWLVESPEDTWGYQFKLCTSKIDWWKFGVEESFASDLHKKRFQNQ